MEGARFKGRRHLATDLEQRLRHAKDAIDGVWSDRISRWCLVAAGVSVWLTLSLVEAAFLAPLLLACGGIWMRRGARAARAAVADDDDWL